LHRTRVHRLHAYQLSRPGRHGSPKCVARRSSRRVRAVASAALASAALAAGEADQRARRQPRPRARPLQPLTLATLVCVVTCMSRPVGTLSDRTPCRHARKAFPRKRLGSLTRRSGSESSRSATGSPSRRRCTAR
jgi:hypothetical protein